MYLFCLSSVSDLLSFIISNFNKHEFSSIYEKGLAILMT